jgi:hypothetical protein
MSSHKSLGQSLSYDMFYAGEVIDKYKGGYWWLNTVTETWLGLAETKYGVKKSLWLVKQVCQT